MCDVLRHIPGDLRRARIGSAPEGEFSYREDQGAQQALGGVQTTVSARMLLYSLAEKWQLALCGGEVQVQCKGSAGVVLRTEPTRETLCLCV